jgi:hypothetical protein
MKPKRKDIVPGAILTVRKGHKLTLDAYRMLSGGSWDMLDGGICHVITGPRKLEGINLVRVKVNAEQEFEVFYCDVLKHCEV